MSHSQGGDCSANSRLGPLTSPPRDGATGSGKRDIFDDPGAGNVFLHNLQTLEAMKGESYNLIHLSWGQQILHNIRGKSS